MKRLYMSRTETECQPCDDFKEHDDGMGMFGNRHSCVWCGSGTVSFCDNCASDHHVGGWQSCDPTAEPAMTCVHPVCVAKRVTP